ncbi:MAG: tetratricopeptide repeat protein [Leptolyngbya sp. SIOISBB]|nr:tetratricopeptide repeat protein [Leptolyngbya sp. SIOISBB]
MTISLCMIVKNEAENLPRCLDSIKDCVDEMRILDTGSQDDTIAIAQSYGAIVDTMEWAQDFAMARNQSIVTATGDWIVVLDADETLTAAGRELLNLIRAGEPLGDHDLDSLLAITWLRHEINTVQSPYSEVSRLFRNRDDLRFNRPYHETIDDSVTQLMQADAQWEILLWPSVALLHTGYEADAIAQRDKFARAETIMSTYLAERPQDAYICNKLGALYLSTDQIARGQSLLEQGLAAAPTDASTLYELHYHLGLAYRETGLNAIAIDHYQKALTQEVPEVLKVGAYLNLGTLYQGNNNFTGAFDLFSQAISAAPEFALAHFNLGVVQRVLGDLPGAVSSYKQAIALDPEYAAAYQNLGVVLFKLSLVPESIQAFQQAIALYKQFDPAQAERLMQSIGNLGEKMNADAANSPTAQRGKGFGTSV